MTDDIINVCITNAKNNNIIYKYNTITKSFEFNKCKTYNSTHNVGFIPNTLVRDGNPLEAVVIMPDQLQIGVNVICNIVGAIEITKTEYGVKHYPITKIIAIPIYIYQNNEIVSFEKMFECDGYIINSRLNAKEATQIYKKAMFD